MNTILLHRQAAWGLLLALSLTVGGVVVAPAKSLWKPQTWLSSENGADVAAQQAKKEAESAQLEADRAMMQAQEAMEKAIRAKAKADTLQAGGAAAEKPLEKPLVALPKEEAVPAAAPTEPAAALPRAPEPQATEPTPSAQAEPTPPASEASAIKPTSAGEPWNPMSWFRKPAAAQASPAAVTLTTPPVTAPVETPATEKPAATEQVYRARESEKTAASTENLQAGSEPVSKGNPLNPMKWFAKPAGVGQEPTVQAVTDEQRATETESAPVAKAKAALIETEKGNIAIELFPEQAPLTVENFSKLVKEGFYNRFNMKFHRVIPGFVIQTGDPTGTGAGGSKTHVPLEAKNKLSHNAKGIVAMARGVDPNSASSQFYITLAPQTALDGKYAIFGKVISGMDVLDKIEKDDQMYGVKLVDLDSVVRDTAPEKKKFFSSMF